MRFFLRQKGIDISVKKVGFFGKLFGLMFRTQETGNLLFTFRKNSSTSLHSFFVFFNFLVLWLDDKNNVVDMRMVSPFTFSVSTAKNFSKIVEIPSNFKNKEIIRFFDGKRKV